MDIARLVAPMRKAATQTLHALWLNFLAMARQNTRVTCIDKYPEDIGCADDSCCYLSLGVQS